MKSSWYLSEVEKKLQETFLFFKIGIFWNKAFWAKFGNNDIMLHHYCSLYFSAISSYLILCFATLSKSIVSWEILYLY